MFPIHTPLNIIAQQTNEIIKDFPQLIARMVKESTDYVSQSLEESNKRIEIEFLQDIDDMQKEITDFKQECIETTSATMNYLSEVKNVLKQIEISLNGDSKKSKNVKDKIECIFQSISKAHQKMEQNVAVIDELKKMQNFKISELEGERKHSSKSILNKSRMSVPALQTNELSFGSQKIQSDITNLDGRKALSKKSSKSDTYVTALSEKNDSTFLNLTIAPFDSIAKDHSTYAANNQSMKGNRLEDFSITKSDIDVPKETDLIEGQETSPKRELTESESDDEFQGSIRRRISATKFKNKSQSKLKWIRSVVPMIACPGKRKLLDIEEMSEILYETRDWSHIKSEQDRNQNFTNQNSYRMKKDRNILNESMFTVSTIY